MASLFTEGLGTTHSVRTPKERAMRIVYQRANRMRRANPKALLDIATRAEEEGIDISGSLTSNSQENSRNQKMAETKQAEEIMAIPARKRSALQDSIRQQMRKAAAEGKPLSDFRSRAIEAGADPAQFDSAAGVMTRTLGKKKDADTSLATDEDSSLSDDGVRGDTGGMGAVGMPGGSPSPVTKALTEDPQTTSQSLRDLTKVPPAPPSKPKTDGVAPPPPPPEPTMSQTGDNAPTRAERSISFEITDKAPWKQPAVSLARPPEDTFTPNTASAPATRKQVGIRRTKDGKSEPIFEDVPLVSQQNAANAYSKAFAERAARKQLVARTLNTPGGADMIRRQDKVEAELAPMRDAASKTVDQTAAEIGGSDLYAGERKAKSSGPALKGDKERDVANKASLQKVASEALRRRRAAYDQARRYAYNM